MSRSFAAEPVRVIVPATSANLGSGFDAFGLALARYDEVTAWVTTGGLDVVVTGEGAGAVSKDENHLVVRAMRHAFDTRGAQPAGLAVQCSNRIPHGRGLGSSAAAIVAGVVLARALSGAEDGAGGAGDTPGDRFGGTETDLTLAAELEGHPDNVAACVLGGFTVAWSEQSATAGGRPTTTTAALRLDPAPSITPVLIIPAEQLATEQARRLLPPSVPHRDAVHTATRAALLPYAITERPDLLFAATDDRLHQSYRAPAMPRSYEILTTLRAAGLPAVISGAGPALLVLTTADRKDLVKALVTEGGWSIYDIGIDSGGVRGVRLRGIQD